MFSAALKSRFQKFLQHQKCSHSLMDHLRGLGRFGSQGPYSAQILVSLPGCNMKSRPSKHHADITW